MSVRRLTMGAVAVAVAVAVIGLSVLVASPAFAALEYSHVATFGSEGSGDGQLKFPAGIAVDESTESSIQPAAGDVYVADRENQRVERFSSTGAYLSQWSGAETQAKSFTINEGGIAVDNSDNPLDPAAGDVYIVDGGNVADGEITPFVIDQFTSEGVFTGLEIRGRCEAPGTCAGKEIPFSGVSEGVTVDSSGNLWTIENDGTVDEFSDTGKFIQSYSIPDSAARGIQVDASDHLYTTTNGLSRLSEFVGPKEVAQFPLNPNATPYGPNAAGFGLNTNSNEFLVDTDASIERFVLGGANIAPAVETFGGEELTDSYSMTVNGADPKRALYAVQRAVGNVEIFYYGDFPKAVTGKASEASETGMSLQGTVNPEGRFLTECRFEYGTTNAYGDSVPCQQSLSAIGEGSAFVPVSADISGLSPSSTRHFRLVAVNAAGPKYGKDMAVNAPSVGSVSASSVGSSEVMLESQITPGGLPTTYSVEYGTSQAYGSRTPVVTAGAGTEETDVRVALSGLQADTIYHARLSASNEIGTVRSDDFQFTTNAAAEATASSLPDDRAYELVSTANQGDVYAPSIGKGVKGQIDTGRPFRASSDGERIAYLAEPPSVGGSGSQGIGEEFLAKRSSEGWSGEDIVPTGAATETGFQTFSSDLALGIFIKGRLKNVEAAEAGQCDELIARAPDGKLHPFFTDQPTVNSCGEHETRPYFAGASADYSHLLFESQAALVEGAEEATGTESEGYNLYDSINGHLHLVNILPGANPAPDPNATFGGPHRGVGSSNNPPGFSNVISSDGSRIFWTDRNTTQIYMRLDEKATVPISVGDARFWTATPDGGYVFYSEEERLWRFNVDRYLESKKPEAEALEEAREPLTNEGAGVVGVIGINETGEDGAYVYFVAEGVLANNENTNRETAMEGAPNLYMRHGGETRFVATLMPGDNELGGPLKDNSIEIGDWQHNLGDRTAEVTPDGHAIALLSHARLTGYDNDGIVEAYVYDADSGQMSCASCSPTGAPASSEAVVPTTDTIEGNTYMERWLSDDGSRVFFETKDQLVPLDSNGLWNVYEWEREGTGTCISSQGCVFLLSGGGSTENSFFVDASSDGSNVFFTSREDFVPEAHGEIVKLYDARVGGGFAKSATACTGSGCQGVPPAPPIFATPSSVTFNGVGNLEAPPVKAVKPKKKRAGARSKRGKLARTLAVCRRKPKPERARCEKRARRLYAQATKRGKR